MPSLSLEREALVGPKALGGPRSGTSVSLVSLPALKGRKEYIDRLNHVW